MFYFWPGFVTALNLAHDTMASLTEVSSDQATETRISMIHGVIWATLAHDLPSDNGNASRHPLARFVHFAFLNETTKELLEAPAAGPMLAHLTYLLRACAFHQSTVLATQREVDSSEVCEEIVPWVRTDKKQNVYTWLRKYVLHVSVS